MSKTKEKDNAHNITRREFVKTGMKAAGVAFGLNAGLAPIVWAPKKAHAANDQVTFCTWGGALTEQQRKYLFDPFAKESGIKVIEATLPLIAKIKAQVDTGNIEWDVIQHDLLTIISLQKAGDYLEKIDYNKIKPEILKSIPEDLKTPYGVGYMYWSYNIAYRTDAFGGDHPKNWSDVWNVEKFPGKRTLTSAKGGQYPNLEFALLAEGVPMDKIYPIAVDRAFKSLDKIKPHVLQWWDSGKQPGDLLQNKEITCGSAYSGRIAALMEAGKPVAVEWNQGQLSVDYLAILKGTQNYEAAMKFINFALESKNQANTFNHYMGGPCNLSAFDYISKERATMLPSSEENRSKMYMQDAQWWAENQEKIFESFMAWTLS